MTSEGRKTVNDWKRFAAWTTAVAMAAFVVAGCTAAKSADSNAAVPTKTMQATQTTCPVSGDPIDPRVFTEFEGKKVYFCCSMCIGTFKADPAKYLDGSAPKSSMHPGHGA